LASVDTIVVDPLDNGDVAAAASWARFTPSTVDSAVNRTSAEIEGPPVPRLIERSVVRSGDAV
jgi:hypothetical protein